MTMKMPEHPRVARTAPVWQNVGKTLLQIVGMWGLFLAVLPLIIVSLERMLGLPGFELSGFFGWTLFGAASVLGFSCGMLFAVYGEGTPLPLDTANRFVLIGPYRYIRNPMALAGILQGVAVALVLGSWGVLVYSILGAVVWHALARPWEEADLHRRFGAAYAEYQRAVPLWAPRLTPYRQGELQEPEDNS